MADEPALPDKMQNPRSQRNLLHKLPPKLLVRPFVAVGLRQMPIGQGVTRAEATACNFFAADGCILPSSALLSAMFIQRR